MPNYSNYAYSKGGGVRVWTNGFAINEPSFYGYVFLENTVVNYNLGKFTGKTYRSIVTGHIYYQIEASFNKTSGLSSITQGERAWVWAYDLTTQPYGSPDVTTNDTKKYNPPNEPTTKPTTSNPTYKDPNSYWDWTRHYSIGTYNNPANIRLTASPYGVIAVANIPAGVEIYVDLRPQYWQGDWRPARIAQGKAGWVHKSVISATKITASPTVTTPTQNYNPTYNPPQNQNNNQNESGGAGDGKSDSTYLFGAVALGLLLLTGGKSGLF